MAIAIGSDIVLGVVNSANPRKKLAAQAALEGGIGKTFSAFFDKLLKPSISSHGAKFIAHTKVRDLPTDLIAGVMDSADSVKLASAVQNLKGEDVQVAMAELDAPKSTVEKAAGKQNQQFEAMMLRSFVEDMMPKSTGGLYGEGTAGDIWRSMEVDYMSQEIAKSGGIGIAEILNKGSKNEGVANSSNSLNRIDPKGALFGFGQPIAVENTNLLPNLGEEQTS